MRRLPLLALPAIVACAARTATPPPPPPRATATAGPPGPGEPVQSGVPHLRAIDQVLLSRDGRTALTRDLGGGVRLWPALDGSKEPLVVPLRGAARLAFATHAGATTIAAVDATGGGQALRLDADGRVRTLFVWPPHEPLQALEVLPDGTAFVALGRDHAIHQLDERGAETGRLEERDFRAGSLHVADEGRALLAVELERLPDVAVTGPTRLRRRFEVRLHRLAVAPLRRVAEPITFEAVLPVPELAVSPDGQRVAAVHVDNGFTGLLVFETHGARSFFTLPEAVAHEARVVFVSPTRVVVTSGNEAWTVDIRFRPDGLPVVSPAKRMSTMSGGGGRWATAEGSWLFVGDPLQPDERRWLGYGGGGVRAVALSPSGRRVAWAIGDGRIVVEPAGEAGGGETRVLAPKGGALDLEFLDEERLLVLAPGGRLAILRGDGQGLAFAESGGHFEALELDATRTLLRVRTAPADPWAWFYEVGPDALVGPRLVAAGGTRAGFLRRRGDGSPAVWTLADGVWRDYLPAELRHADSRDLAQRGRRLPPGDAEPIAVDGDARRYYLREGPSRLERVDGGARVTAPVQGFVTARALPSPDGSRLALADVGGLVVVYATASLRPELSLKPGTSVTDLAWSGDGTRLAVAGLTGGLVLDAADGAVLARRCAGPFEAGSTPPAEDSDPGEPSVCE